MSPNIRTVCTNYWYTKCLYISVQSPGGVLSWVCYGSRIPLSPNISQFILNISIESVLRFRYRAQGVCYLLPVRRYTAMSQNIMTAYIIY